eukprot:8249971-Alexandrium_andersonii.AAC.1
MGECSDRATWGSASWCPCCCVNTCLFIVRHLFWGGSEGPMPAARVGHSGTAGALTSHKLNCLNPHARTPLL